MADDNPLDRKAWPVPIHGNDGLQMPDRSATLRSLEQAAERQKPIERPMDLKKIILGDSWKTSLIGWLLGGLVIANDATQGRYSWIHLVLGIAAVLGFRAAKDANVHGDGLVTWLLAFTACLAIGCTSTNVVKLTEAVPAYLRDCRFNAVLWNTDSSACYRVTIFDPRTGITLGPFDDCYAIDSIPPLSAPDAGTTGP